MRTASKSARRASSSPRKSQRLFINSSHSVTRAKKVRQNSAASSVNSSSSLAALPPCEVCEVAKNGFYVGSPTDSQHCETCEVCEVVGSSSFNNFANFASLFALLNCWKPRPASFLATSLVSHGGVSANSSAKSFEVNISGSRCWSCACLCPIHPPASPTPCRQQRVCAIGRLAPLY